MAVAESGNWEVEKYLRIKQSLRIFCSTFFWWRPCLRIWEFRIFSDLRPFSDLRMFYGSEPWYSDCVRLNSLQGPTRVLWLGVTLCTALLALQWESVPLTHRARHCSLTAKRPVLTLSAFGCKSHSYKLEVHVHVCNKIKPK